MGWVKNKGSLKKFQVGGKVPVAPRVPGVGVPGVGAPGVSGVPSVPPMPLYEEGGKVTPYERNQAKRDAMKKRRAKAIAARKAKKAKRKSAKVDTKAVKADTPKAAKADKPKKKRKPIGAKKVVETKGGDYPVYKKKSLKAKSFREAFADAKGSDFTWKGRKYHGRTKEEESARKAKKAKSAATKKKRDEEFKKGAESSVSGTVYPPKRGK